MDDRYGQHLSEERILRVPTCNTDIRVLVKAGTRIDELTNAGLTKA